MLSALTDRGFEVSLSPATGKNQDPRWDGWYDWGLVQELKLVDAFIAADGGQSGSTWMAIEYSEALKLKEETGRPQVYYWEHPESPIFPNGCWSAYSERSRILPAKVEAAVEMLVENYPID